MSFFVTIRQGTRERTLWGVGLKAALEAADARPGDTIQLRRTGAQPVTVDGKATRRNQWAIRVDGRDRERGDARSRPATPVDIFEAEGMAHWSPEARAAFRRWVQRREAQLARRPGPRSQERPSREPREPALRSR